MPACLEQDRKVVFPRWTSTYVCTVQERGALAKTTRVAFIQSTELPAPEIVSRDQVSTRATCAPAPACSVSAIAPHCTAPHRTAARGSLPTLFDASLHGRVQSLGGRAHPLHPLSLPFCPDLLQTFDTICRLSHSPRCLSFFSPFFCWPSSDPGQATDQNIITTTTQDEAALAGLPAASVRYGTALVLGLQ